MFINLPNGIVNNTHMIPATVQTDANVCIYRGRSRSRSRSICYVIHKKLSYINRFVSSSSSSVLLACGYIFFSTSNILSIEFIKLWLKLYYMLLENYMLLGERASGGPSIFDSRKD